MTRSLSTGRGSDSDRDSESGSDSDSNSESGAGRGRPGARSIFDLGVDEAHAILEAEFGAGSQPPLEAVENEDWGRDQLLTRLAGLGPARLAELGLTLEDEGPGPGSDSDWEPDSNSDSNSDRGVKGF